MALVQELHTIVWSPKALKSYEEILQYIEGEFNDIAVQKFVRKTLTMLAHIARDPAMFRKSDKGKHKHIVVVTEKTTLYYRVKPRKREVQLLLFWDNRRNPNHLDY